MSANVIISVAAVLVSVTLNWFPKLKDKFDVLDDWLQSVIVLVIMAVAALLVFGAKCAQLDLPFVVWAGTCDATSAKELLSLYITAVVSGGIAFVVLPKPNK